MARSPETRCWLIDFAASKTGQLSASAQVATEMLAGMFANQNSVVVLPVALVDSADCTKGVTWNARQSEHWMECANQLLRPDVDANCELLAVFLPKTMAELLKRCLEKDQFLAANAAVQIAKRSGEPASIRAGLSVHALPREHEFSEEASIALWRTVILAHYLCATRRGKAVFFTEPRVKDESPQAWTFHVESNRALFTQLEPADEDGLRQYLLTILGGDLYGFHPKFDDNKPPGSLLENTSVSEDWGDRSKQPYDEAYYHWYRQEFGSRATGQLFTEACWRSICDLKCKQHTERTLLPVAIQNAIGAARMCRRMSTWTLEGTPFACTVVLLSAEAMNSIGASTSRFSRLIDLRPPAPFNLRNSSAIRDHAELAQSDGLFMLASAHDGMLHSIGTARLDREAPPREVRHSFFSWLSESGALIFDIRPTRVIHLYGQNGLLLDHDGFEWLPSPMAYASEIISSFFSSSPSATSSDDKPGFAGRPSPETTALRTRTLSDAMRRLVDDNESSIFALLDFDDVGRATQSAVEMLRPNIRWSASDRVSISGMDSESLAGLLHLDGAHLISRDGHVLSVSRRISSRLHRAGTEIQINNDQANKIESAIASTDGGSVNGQFGVFTEGLDIPELRFYRWIRQVDIDRWKLQEWMKGDNCLQTKIQSLMDNETPAWTVVTLKGLADSQISTLRRDIFRGLAFQSCITRQVKFQLYDPDADDGEPKSVPALLILMEDCGTPSVDWEAIEITEVPDFHERVRSIRMRRETFPYDAARLKSEQRWPAGVAFDSDPATVFIQAEVMDQRLDGKEIIDVDPRGDGDLLLDVVKQQFVEWRNLGRAIGTQSPGTGTRAAMELSRKLPSSLIVKVSASGGFKLFRRGKKVPIDDPLILLNR